MIRFNTHKNLPLLFGLAAGGFIVLSFIIGIAPSLWVEAHNAPLPGSSPMTAEEQAGLRVFVSEGCGYCHTQQIRPLSEDTLYGRPSAPGDYARLTSLSPWIQVPEILGTERTGPDLSDIAARQPSDVWQYMHLYQPRSVVPQSIMPAFPWLFGPNREPTPRAKALVAYLLSLKQTPIGTPKSAASGGSAAGAQVFATRCASCHQASGAGVPGAFPPLAGDSVVNGPGTAQIDIVLNGLHGKAINGVSYASAMPAWRTVMSDAEIAAVITYERASWGNHGSPVAATDVAAERGTTAPAP
jgi:cytochrome c oxidase cbb3-type subunit 2